MFNRRLVSNEFSHRVIEQQSAMTVGLKIDTDVIVRRFMMKMFHACRHTSHGYFLYKKTWRFHLDTRMRYV